MTIAVHYETGKEINPKPNTGSRDRHGHFIGCGFHSCAVMRCRELFSGDIAAHCRTVEFLWKRV